MENHNADDLRARASVNNASVAFDVARWAKLVADGFMPWPDGIDPKAEIQLATQVNRLKRGKVVRVVASAIASAIHRGAENREENRND